MVSKSLKQIKTRLKIERHNLEIAESDLIFAQVSAEFELNVIFDKHGNMLNDCLSTDNVELSYLDDYYSAREVVNYVKGRISKLRKKKRIINFLLRRQRI
jgi:hypothetical protein